MVTGATLLFAPRHLLEQPSPLRRWLLEIDLGELFNRHYAIERRVYRRHRLFGGIVLVGSVATMLLLWYATSHKLVPKWLIATLGKLGFRAVILVAATVALILLIFGLCLLIRPSVLKGVEAAANRRIQPVAANRVRREAGRWVIRSPRVAGAILLVGGFVCLRPF